MDMHWIFMHVDATDNEMLDFFLRLCYDGYLGTFMLLGYDYDTRVVSYFVKRVSFVLW